MRALLLVAMLGCVDEAAPVQPIDEQPAAPVDTSEFGAFIACIERADFDAANMATAWASIAAQNQTCATCHTDVEYSGDADAFFDALAQRTYVQLKFFAFEDGAVVVNERTIPAVGKSGAHPRFNASAGIAATRDLYERTRANCP